MLERLSFVCVVCVLVRLGFVCDVCVLVRLWVCCDVCALVRLAFLFRSQPHTLTEALPLRTCHRRRFISLLLCFVRRLSSANYLTSRVDKPVDKKLNQTKLKTTLQLHVTSTVRDRRVDLTLIVLQPSLKGGLCPVYDDLGYVTF